MRLAGRLPMRLLAVLAMSLVGCSTLAPSRDATDPPDDIQRFTGEDFYTPPDPLPDGQPGDIVWAEELPGPRGASVWRVLYRSESLDGTPIAVSGIVGIPDGVSTGGPIVAVAHGTVGLGDQCAPSRHGLHPRALDYLHEGYIVSATDYEGLGTPGPHPYIVGASQARGVIDGVRAARHLASQAGHSFAVVGHSQGGHASLFVGQIAATWAPELDLVGVVAIAAPALETADDMVVDAPSPPQGARGGYALMIASAWSEVYPELELEDLLTAHGAEIAVQVRELCAEDLGALFPAAALQPVTHTPAREHAAWAQRIAQNAPGREPIGAPVLLMHGTADDVVAASDTERILGRICAHDGVASRLLYPDRDHLSVIADYPRDAIAWIRDRFDREPPPDDC